MSSLTEARARLGDRVGHSRKETHFVPALSALDGLDSLFGLFDNAVLGFASDSSLELFGGAELPGDVGGHDARLEEEFGLESQGALVVK